MATTRAAALSPANVGRAPAMAHSAASASRGAPVDAASRGAPPAAQVSSAKSRAAPAATLPPAPRGVLFKQELGERLSLDHVPPRAELSRYVVRYWIARWDLDDGEVRRQQVIPHPCANLQIEGDRVRVYGVASRIRAIDVRGRGQIVGVKLAPAALRAFWARPASELTDRAVEVDEVFSAPVDAWLAAAQLPRDEMAAAFDALIARDVPATVDPRLAYAQLIHEEIAAHPELLYVDELASRHQRSARSLQLLFRDYFGVTPKWMIMRYRMHEAAERIAADPALSLAQLSRALGYCDQPHFSRSFSQVVGMPPAKYARRCQRAAKRAAR